MLPTPLPFCGLTLRLGSSNSRYLQLSSGTAHDHAARRTGAQHAAGGWNVERKAFAFWTHLMLM